ncbi:MAG: phosphatase PAP2 family protein [Proteobacteria bacterium]|nr:phosphatase PAP2 family protein [Pseudomonadota bacterium]
MLLWFGILLLALGIAAFALDRRAVHFFHDRISRKWEMRIWRTTDFAKGAHWLVLSLAALVGVWIARFLVGDDPVLQTILKCALAFLVSLAIGSAILHTLKIFLGRRRPRDELELKYYGFMPFHFFLQHDSFPSGHALTIFCVAVILSGVFPMLAVLWFAIALYLALTRAFLTAHFLSDVFIGAGIGVLVTRSVTLDWFGAIAQSWF